MPGVDERVPERGCGGRGHVDLDTVLARVAGARDDPVADAVRLRSAGHRLRPPRSRRSLSRALRTLHREHRTRRGDVGRVDTTGRTRERVEQAIRVRRVRHHEEPLGRDPPHDDVVDDVRVVRVEEVGVLRAAGRDAAEIVGEQPLQRVVCVRAGALDGAEVRHVEHHRVVAARAVFLEHSPVLDRHVPAAELRPSWRRGRDAGRRAGWCAPHALSAVGSAVARGRPAIDVERATAVRCSGAPAATSCDGGSRPYFTSRWR